MPALLKDLGTVDVGIHWGMKKNANEATSKFECSLDKKDSSFVNLSDFGLDFVVKDLLSCDN